MKRIELVRWGVPTLAFLVYFKWGGMTLSMALFAILLIGITGLIHWQEKDPGGFYHAMRVWIVAVGVLPALALTVLGPVLSLVLLPFGLALLALSIWLFLSTNQKIKEHRGEGPMSGPMRILHGRGQLNAVAEANHRAEALRQKVYDLQAENLDLAKKNYALVAELEKQTTSRPLTLAEELAQEDYELFGDNNPYANPTPPSRTP